MTPDKNVPILKGTNYSPGVNFILLCKKLTQGIHISQVPIRSSEKGKNSAKQCQKSGTEPLNRGGFGPLWTLGLESEEGDLTKCFSHRNFYPQAHSNELT